MSFGCGGGDGISKRTNREKTTTTNPIENHLIFLCVCVFDPLTAPNCVYWTTRFLAVGMYRRMPDFIWFYHTLTNNINSKRTSFYSLFFWCYFHFNLWFEREKRAEEKKHSTIWHLFWFSYDRLMIAYAHSIHFIVNSVGKSVLFLSNILFFWWVHIHFRGKKIVKKPTWTWIGTDGKESSTM